MKFVAYNHRNNVHQPFITEDPRRDLSLPSAVSAFTNGIILITLSRLWADDQKLIAFDILNKFLHAEFGQGFDAAIMGASDCSYLRDLEAFFTGIQDSGAKPIVSLASTNFENGDVQELVLRFGCAVVPEMRDDLMVKALGVLETDTLSEADAQSLGVVAERLETFFNTQHDQRDRQTPNYRIGI